MLYELAMHPERQDRLRSEVTDARARFGNADYERLMALRKAIAWACCTQELISCDSISRRRMQGDTTVVRLVGYHYQYVLSAIRLIDTHP